MIFAKVSHCRLEMLQFHLDTRDSHIHFYFHASRCCLRLLASGGSSLNVCGSNKERVHVLYSALLFLSDTADPAFVIFSWAVFDQGVSLWIMPKHNLANEWIFGFLFMSSFFFKFFCHCASAVIAHRLTGAWVSDLIPPSPSVRYSLILTIFFLWLLLFKSFIQRANFARTLS